jgi:hypothetical protein
MEDSMPCSSEPLESAPGPPDEQRAEQPAGSSSPPQTAGKSLVKGTVFQPACLAAARPIAAGNVGMRLLERMGWQEGSGAPCRMAVVT